MDYEFKPGVSIPLGESPETDHYLRALVSSNMEYVEIGYDKHRAEPSWQESVKKIIDASHVKVNSIHAPFSSQVDISLLDDSGREYALDQIRRSIEMTTRLEAGILVIHGSAEPIEAQERSERLDRCKSSLKILANEASNSGIRLAVEFLPRTCLGNTADELLFMLEDMPSELVGVCLDTNHPADPGHIPAIVKQLAHRIITLHISDYDGIHERHWIPFRGVVNWGAFANALRDVGYTGAFIYETMLEEGHTTEEKLANIYANFKKILSSAKAQRNGT